MSDQRILLLRSGGRVELGVRRSPLRPHVVVARPGRICLMGIAVGETRSRAANTRSSGQTTRAAARLSQTHITGARRPRGEEKRHTQKWQSKAGRGKKERKLAEGPREG
jgi:hypothetical protein